MPAVIYSSLGSIISGYTTLRTNLVRNPSFETDTSFWTTTGTSFTRITSDDYSGAASGQLVCGAINNAALITESSLTASRTYTASAWVKGEAGKMARIDIRELTAASAIVGDTLGSFVTMTGAWQRISVSRAFGGTGVQATLLIRNVSAATHTILIDAVQLEETTSGAYFDGSTADLVDPPGPDARDYSWVGTTHLSRSLERQPTYAGIYGTVPAIDPLITSSWRSGNRVHRLLGRAEPEVTYAAAGLREGTIELFYATDEAAAAEAEQMFRDGTTFLLAYPDRPEWEMAFVLAEGGQVVRELVGSNRNHWTVRVDYQEIDEASY